MDQQTSPVLVTGATGNTGRAVLDALIERRAPVRAMVRTEADRSKLPAGVPVAVADFDDAASIAAALEGARRAYLVTPSSERAEAQQQRFADLSAQAGVDHLVVLSQLAADEQSPVRFLRYHAAVERHVRDLGIAYTFLRPNLFFQGLLAFAGPIAAQGQFYAPIGEARVSAIDVRDIAAVAATTLTEACHEGAIYTLTGPASITHAQIAGADLRPRARHHLHRRTTRNIRQHPAGAPATLAGPGPAGGLRALPARGGASVSPAVAEVTGRPPRDVSQFARDYAPAFAS